MQSFVASNVGVPDDTGLEYGEGSLSFVWPDPLCGQEGLTIELDDGHCSREMPIRSGKGPPQFLDVRRDSIVLRFTTDLAGKLELDEEVEIKFAIGDQEFVQLQRTIDYFKSFDVIAT